MTFIYQFPSLFFPIWNFQTFRLSHWWPLCAKTLCNNVLIFFLKPNPCTCLTHITLRGPSDSLSVGSIITTTLACEIRWHMQRQYLGSLEALLTAEPSTIYIYKWILLQQNSLSSTFYLLCLILYGTFLHFAQYNIQK